MINNNYPYYNFYLIKNFFFLYYFLYNYNFNKFYYLSYKNDFNFNVLNIQKKSFLIKNYFNIKLSIYLNTFKPNFNKNIFFSKISINSNLYYTYIFNKNFISFFFDFNFKKKNFLILDNNYSYVYPLYKYIFGLNTLYLYKNFFFLKPIFFTRKNWSYFFLKFCNYNKINLLFISDFDYYINFYKSILQFDCSVSAIIPYNYNDSFIDYPLYSNTVDNLIKIAYFSTLSQIYFYSYNKINFYLKYQYINTFYKYTNTLNKN